MRKHFEAHFERKLLQVIIKQWNFAQNLLSVSQPVAGLLEVDNLFLYSFIHLFIHLPNTSWTQTELSTKTAGMKDAHCFSQEPGFWWKKWVCEPFLMTPWRKGAGSSVGWEARGSNQKELSRETWPSMLDVGPWTLPEYNSDSDFCLLDMWNFLSVSHLFTEIWGCWQIKWFNISNHFSIPQMQ